MKYFKLDTALAARASLVYARPEDEAVTPVMYQRE